MTIYIIQWLDRRNYGDPSSKVFTDLHEAQAFALELLQEFQITNDDFIECACGYDLESIWRLNNWTVYTADRCSNGHDVYIDFATKTINLPQE